MVRKRIPVVTRPDQSYAASLARHDLSQVQSPAPLTPAQNDTETGTGAGDPSQVSALTTPQKSERSPEGREEGPVSVQIDVRVSALKRQEEDLLACGIAPRQVIRAALRRAVKGWDPASVYVPPAEEERVAGANWTVRTSVAVPTAVFDRLLAAHDPLGVCSRWSLTRGQLEPLVWREIDALLASFRDDRSPDD